MKRITTTFEEYKSALTGELIKFNYSSKAFCIIKTPSNEEFEEVLREFVDLKIKVTWRELLEPITKQSSKKHEPDRLRLFAATKSSVSNTKYAPTYIMADYYTKAIGEPTTYKCYLKLADLSIEQQRALANSIEPKNLKQAQAMFKVNTFAFNDPIGTQFISGLIHPQEDFTKALDALIDLVHDKVKISGDSSLRSKYQRKNVTPRNALEFMSFLHAKGFILFPFIRHLTDDTFEKWLTHKNTTCWLEQPEFVNTEAYDFCKVIKDTATGNQSYKAHYASAKAMIRATTFSKAEHASDALLNRTVEMYKELYEVSARNKSTVDKHASSYNRFTNVIRDIYNSKHNDANLKLTHSKPIWSANKTLNERVDYSEYIENYPKLKTWADLFSKWSLSINDTQVGVRIQASKACLAWLARLDDIPLSPLEIVRDEHINDYSDGNTLRNYIKNKHSIKVCATLLTLYNNFFDFVHDQLFKDPSNREALKNYVNPINLRFDRFATTHVTGTSRTPIEARIMDELRKLIIEDDYAFPKKAFTFCYGNLTNHVTGEYEKEVFCPSVANLLYFMLWVPVRKIQAQLLDSGEGDNFIYDFEDGKLVENINKIGDKKGRKEGLLQMLPSGVLGITDILGLHITTNKTSDKAYDIPWVCEELLESLKNQYQWLAQYSPYPELRGRSSLGKIMTEDGEKSEKKFYCLFRDPTSTRGNRDQSKPVTATVISKAFGLLCAEAEKRINEKLSDGKNKISLTKKDDPKKSRYDIHTLRVSGITDLLDKGVPLGIVQKFVAGHATFVMTLHYDNPSHSRVREHLENARQKQNSESDFDFDESKLGDLRSHFVVNQNYGETGYTAFDALEKNAGIASVKLSGICPGTSCEEGGYDFTGKAAIPVPAGDRGPSCPQCRFWLTGPMFLLGQVIEGNQLIRKIKKKVSSIDKIRESMIDAEDDQNIKLYNQLSGREERELRILSNMLSEWSERMKYYEVSVTKLDAWQDYKNSKDEDDPNMPVPFITKSTEDEVQYGFGESSNLELTHFITTVAEFFPEFIDSDDTSVLDLEQTITRFMAINDLGDIMFKLNEAQRLTATNMMTDMLINSVGAKHAENLLDDKQKLDSFPALKEKVKHLVNQSEEKVFRLDPHSFELIGELHE